MKGTKNETGNFGTTRFLGLPCYLSLCAAVVWLEGVRKCVYYSKLRI